MPTGMQITFGSRFLRAFDKFRLWIYFKKKDKKKKCMCCYGKLVPEKMGIFSSWALGLNGPF